MNNRIIILTVMIAYFSATSSITAQTQFDTGVENVLDALNSGSDNFEELGTKINNLKITAKTAFEKEQDAINKEQTRIDRNQAELDKDKNREAQMMYDEWLVRSKANEKLMLDIEQLHERKLALTMRKTQFKDQIAQAEQKVVSAMASQIEEQMRIYNARMKLLKDQLSEVEF